MRKKLSTFPRARPAERGASARHGTDERHRRITTTEGKAKISRKILRSESRLAITPRLYLFGGVRPSPGAASSNSLCISDSPGAAGTLEVAAPGDERTPPKRQPEKLFQARRRGRLAVNPRHRFLPHCQSSEHRYS